LATRRLVNGYDIIMSASSVFAENLQAYAKVRRRLGFTFRRHLAIDSK
jgi:hypothetical protein